MSNVYDGAFRTIVNDCRKLIIPVINEVFGEMYSGEEQETMKTYRKWVI